MRRIAFRRLFPAAGLPLLTLAAAASAAGAQSISSPYRFVDTRLEAGLFAGQQFLVGDGAFGIGPKPGPAAGGRFGITIGGPFSLEANGAYMKTTRDVKDPGLDGDLTTVGEADVELLMLDARIKFMPVGERTWHRVSPHVLVGGGITFDISGDQSADQLLLPEDRYSFGNSFTGILGIGFRWFVSRRLLVRPDLALQLWQQDIPDGYPDREALARAPDSEWIQTWGLMIGASYNF